MRWILTIILFAGSLLGATQSRADDLAADREIWCPQVADADLSPHGALVQVGSRVFRTCEKPVSPLGERGISLDIGENFVPGLVHNRVLRTLSVSDRSSGEEWWVNMLRNKEPVGMRVFGGVSYREYDHEEATAETKDLSSFFVYEPGLNSGNLHYPPHAIDCADKSIRESGTHTCFLFVFYWDVRARVMLIGDGRNFLPLPREDFPEMILDMERALIASDVTDRATSLRETIPFFD